MAENGINTVQLWVVWGWVEPRPGDFRFDDYDRLVSLAAEHQMEVVISTIAEVHPLWIHREVPGSEMIDNFGRRVISASRYECHFGLSPGGDINHPGVWEKMAIFIEQVVTRYRSQKHLFGWDAWNELRWNVGADGHVSYSAHALANFRQWLDQRHGGLEGLNRAWQRRYCDWEEVHPGKTPGRPYTEMMAFLHYLHEMASSHGRMRYDLIKKLDPERPVTVHGAVPTAFHADKDAYELGQGCLARGNDWDYAEYLDGVGTSSFPVLEGYGEDEFAARIMATASASLSAGGKRIWLSEVQGGQAAHGTVLHQPVPADLQQRWIWNGVATGAEAILFWCWRDEVFGKESGGFGLTGNDGCARARLDAMRKTGRLIREHAEFLAGYQMNHPRIGIYFSPQTNFLYWSQHGQTRAIGHALKGYAIALTRLNLPYLFVEENRLHVLDQLDVLFMPHNLVLDAEAEEALTRFVQRGGLLLTESECGAFDSTGIWRYPEERFLSRLADISEEGRRSLHADQTIQIEIEGHRYRLATVQWRTPLCRFGDQPSQDSLHATSGKGEIRAVSSYLGEPYYEAFVRCEGSPPLFEFEQFLKAICAQRHIRPTGEALDAPAGAIHVKTGKSRGVPCVFLFFRDDREEVIVDLGGELPLGPVCDLLSGAQFDAGPESRITRGEWGVRLLTPVG